ncbi:uncharacterized protein LOC134265557 isoform X2 [Saccostrea cucullata]
MSWDWFEAQQQCHKINDTLPRNTSASTEMEIWTGFYLRQSSWIKILGCFDSKNIYGYQEFLKNHLSAGYCHEICSSLNSTIFGIKEKKCVCLGRSILSKTILPNQCNETCRQDTEGFGFSECGGPNAYSVYTADSSFLPNCTKAENGGKATCLAVNCGTEQRFSISTSCSESYFGVCEVKEYLGCFEDQSSRTLSGEDKWARDMTIKLCRKFCSDRKRKLFGVEYSNECFCGNDFVRRIKKAERECNMTCGGDNRQICGGPWRINIYRTPYFEIDKNARQNWTESMKWCKTWSPPTYLSGNVSLVNANQACQALHRKKDGLSWLGIAKEVYEGYDRGISFDTNHRRTFLKCQKCNHTSCEFVDCFQKLNSILCEKTSLEESTTVDFPLTIYENLENPVPLISLIVSLVVVFILAICTAVVVTWLIRKRGIENKDNKINHQMSNSISENVYVNVNDDPNMMKYNSEQRPSSKHFIRPENPEQNLDKPYRETVDDVYDHLGDKETKQNKNDNVYDHAHFAAESEDGVYNISTSGTSQNKSQDEATYDHAASYSDYGHHGEQVDKMEDTYSRLQIKSRSGH